MTDGTAEQEHLDGDLAGVSDEELQEWIDEARAELARQAPGDDPEVSATRVAMGLWLAELAERQGDGRHLEAALTAVAQAVADDPGHDDAQVWQGILGQLHWARYEAAFEPGMPPDRLLALLAEPVRHLEAAADLLAPGEELSRQVGARLGLAYGFRFLGTSDPADLEAGLTRLGEALDGVPEPMGQPSYFRFHYGQQYARRFDLTGNEADLDRACAEIRRAVEDGESSTEREGGWFPAARAQLARILLLRVPAVREHRNPHDVALALAQLDHLPLDSPLLAEFPAPVLRQYGRLLRERGVEQTRPADSRRALAVLRQTAERWPADAPDRWSVLMDLAAGWQVVALDTLDAEALRCAEDAYAEALSDPTCPPGLRNFLEATRGYLRGVRVRAGQLPDDPGDPVIAAGRRAASALQQGMAAPDADGPPDGGDAAHDLQWRGLTSTGPMGDDLQRVIERCQDADAAVVLRRLPMMLMAFFAPFLSGLGISPAAGEIMEAVRAAMAALPQEDPLRTSLHMVAGQTAMTVGGQSYDVGQLQIALEQFDIALARPDAAAEDDALRGAREVWRVAALSFRSQVRGTQDALAQAAAELGRLRTDPSVTAYTRVYASVQHAVIRFRQAFALSDATALAAAEEELRAARDRLPADDAVRSKVVALLDVMASARQFAAAGAPDRAAPRVEHADPDAIAPDRVRRESAALPRRDRAEALGMAGMALGLRLMRDPDAGRLDEAIALLRDALVLDPADDGGNGVRYAHTLATFQLHKYHAGRDEADLDQAVRWSEEAVRLAAHPGHFGWATAAMQLADAYRAAGRAGRTEQLARSREVGLRALSGHAWQVLLQSRAQDTAEPIAVAAAQALRVARWCIADGCLEEAAHALDAGRGLVLHAASAAGTVPERLAAADRPDLAAEWRAAAAAHGSGPAENIPGDLRYRVLQALAGTADPVAAAPSADPAGTTAPRDRLGHLLTPPPVPDIATALRRTGADALVYLVPREGTGTGQGGCALAVHTDGRTSVVHLPGLTADAPALAAYLSPRTGSGNRDMGPVAGAPSASPDGRAAERRTLEAVCDWASGAVTEPLLAHLRARGATRPAKVVLVPMGQLAAVPWHAARRATPDGRHRYALQDAVVSYAASARLFCEVMAREPVPYDAPGLVVGNPTGDLPHAGREAGALHTAFYRSAPYLGRHASGAATGEGTPGEVLGWLRLRGLSPAGVLHLACHAEVLQGSAARTSHLRLAGGTLAAEQLTEHAQRRDRPGRLGLVSLAACTTHVSGRGHDEAFTLSTAFLVDGARSVLGSLWPVPDEATSYLMFMVHHYLHAERARPATALRLAQLWMLDPDRRTPATMPPELAAQAGSVDPDDLRGWAGFTHLGQ
ncbi:CHAT domain-containing protein [Streptomyces sp. NPDC015171]|uniref:CHAT domain-containing protein n=1 Tax=Streptomyces sp. NPDC015171 TaxID=3364945 RepID=UPI0036F4F531